MRDFRSESRMTLRSVDSNRMKNNAKILVTLIAFFER